MRLLVVAALLRLAGMRQVHLWLWSAGGSGVQVQGAGVDTCCHAQCCILIVMPALCVCALCAHRCCQLPRQDLIRSILLGRVQALREEFAALKAELARSRQDPGWGQHAAAMTEVSATWRTLTRACAAHRPTPGVRPTGSPSTSPISTVLTGCAQSCCGGASMML